MGAINIKHTGSGSDIALSSDGTNLLLNGTAIGGGGSLNLVKENYGGSSTLPNVTGTDAIGIGERSVVAGTSSTAIGNSYAGGTGYNHSIHLGTNSSSYGATGTMAIAGAGQAKATANYSIAFGYGAQATAQHAFAVGNNALASSTGAVALGASRATGSNSFAAGIGNSASSYGAQASGAIALGSQARVNSNNGVAIGSGARVLSGKNYGVALGARSNCNAKGQFVHGTGSLVTEGYAQTGMLVIHGRTANNTQGTLTSDSSLQSLGTAGSDNQLVVPSYGAIAFDGMIVARGQGNASDTNCAAWKVEGLIRRESAASTTTLVNSAITVIDNTPSWGLALAADTTNGALSVLVTGAASSNVKWVCTLRSSETIYNSY